METISVCYNLIAEFRNWFRIFSFWIYRGSNRSDSLLGTGLTNIQVVSMFRMCAHFTIFMWNGNVPVYCKQRFALVTNNKMKKEASTSFVWTRSVILLNRISFSQSTFTKYKQNNTSSETQRSQASPTVYSIINTLVNNRKDSH